MSKIRMFALGGLNEVGKNMYVIEVDSDIYVFDAGLKHADNRLLGIDYIIPSIEYLKTNEKRIKGIFLTHGHDENIGAIKDIIEHLKSVKIYASKFTMNILKDELKGNNQNLVEIKAYKKLTFGKNSVFPVLMTHSIPEALGYALNTEDGTIFYTGDFTFDATMTGHYKTDMGKLAYIGKQGVLCLLTDSTYAEKEGHTSPNHRIAPVIKEVLYKNNGRIIISACTYSVSRLEELFKEIALTGRKVVVMSKDFQNFVKEAKKEGYLKYDDKIIGNLTNLEDKHTIILVPDQRENALANLSRIANGYDKFVKLKATDTVFVMENIYDQMERQFVKLENKIAKQGVKVISLNKNNLLLHPSKEDLLLMLDLMNPKYYMPVKGEYRYQLANAKLATSHGMNDKNIILKANGEIVKIDDGVLKESFDKIKIDEILVDGISSEDISEIVLRDREILSDNGIVMISVSINRHTKKIIAGPEILTRGFIYVKNNPQIMKEIKDQSIEIVNNNIKNKRVDYKKIRADIRGQIGKYLNKETECRPMIISIINEI